MVPEVVAICSTVRGKTKSSNILLYVSQKAVHIIKDSIVKVTIFSERSRNKTYLQHINFDYLCLLLVCQVLTSKKVG